MRNNRGSILIFSYLIVAALVAMSSALTLRTLAEQNASSRSVRVASAFQAAEAGLDRALVDIRADPNWDGASATQVPNGGFYDVTVTDGDVSTLKVLTVTGHSPSTDPTAWGYQRKQIEAVVQVATPSVFQFGLFGHEEVEVKKAVTTDSYDSSKGSYASQTPGEHGDLGTNNTEHESITVSKDTTINGQIVVGPGMDDPIDAVKLGKNVTITGDPDVISMSQEVELPAVSPPCSCTSDLKLDKSSSTTLTESHGPYCYDKVELKDSASIVVQGNVTLYVNEFTADKDSTVNGSGNPTQFLMEVASDKEVKVKNTGLFVGAIYAPQSEVDIDKSGSFYGSVVANEISIDKEVTIHYDAALTNTGPTSGDSDALLVSWREL